MTQATLHPVDIELAPTIPIPSIRSSINISGRIQMRLAERTITTSDIGTNKLSMKVCRKCELRKTTYEFYRNSSTLDRFESSCGLCARVDTRKELAIRGSTNAYIQRRKQAAVRRHAAKRCELLLDRKSATHWRLLLTRPNEEGLKIVRDNRVALVRECSMVILSRDTDEASPVVAGRKDIKVSVRLKTPRTALTMIEIVEKALGPNAMVKAITPELSLNGCNLSNN